MAVEFSLQSEMGQL